MPVFAIIATKNPESIGKRISADHPRSFIEIREDAWLVDANATTKELAESLGIRSGEVGSGLVVLLGNYSGRASADIWEWLNLHMSQDG